MSIDDLSQVSEAPCRALRDTDVNALERLAKPGYGGCVQVTSTSCGRREAREPETLRCAATAGSKTLSLTCRG